MKSYTHLAFSFLIGIYLIKYLQVQNQILFIIVIMIFSLIPDIDETKSKVSQKIKPIAWIINFLLGHRGLIHSIWFPILIYLLLFMIDLNIAIAASIGYLSHLIIDSFTIMGVRPLWPLKKRLHGFIKVGSLGEHILFIFLLVADIYLLINF